jgi:hypothetical protein
LLLYEKGPFNANEIYSIYESDLKFQDSDYFPNKKYLKIILNSMKMKKKIYSARYDAKATKYEGFHVNPKFAFSKVSQLFGDMVQFIILDIL